MPQTDPQNQVLLPTRLFGSPEFFLVLGVSCLLLDLGFSALFRYAVPTPASLVGGIAFLVGCIVGFTRWRNVSRLRKMATIASCICLCGTVLAAAFLSATRTMQRHSCVECRLFKVVTTTWYSEDTMYSTNVCSEWYRERFPNHVHRWGAYG